MSRKNKTLVTMQALIILATLASRPTAATTQGICTPEELVVRSVSGRVVAHLAQGETPLQHVSVVLLRDHRPMHRVVAATTGDPNGHFEFKKKVKAGDYFLKVSVPHLRDFYFPLRVVAAESAAQPEEIVVTMGADFSAPCGGSSATLKPKKDY